MLYGVHAYRCIWEASRENNYSKINNDFEKYVKN
jgi:hypothetical protein